MPEGPEVETVVRKLQFLVGGILDRSESDPAGKRSFRKLSYLGLPWPRAVELWHNHKTPLTLSRIYRHGKRIFLEHTTPTDPDPWCLICGMGLAGWILVNQLQPVKHNIFTLRYSTGSLHFVDLRRFGSWMLLPAPATRSWTAKTLGPDALTTPVPDLLSHLITHQTIRRYAHHEIKTVILDQVLISGFGNIYACEACFDAKVSPWKPFGDCTYEELKRILVLGQAKMQQSVTRGGTSFRDFKAPDGTPGTTQQFLSVFRQKCCSICTTPIQRVLLKGRGTYFCPTCQHVPG